MNRDILDGKWHQMKGALRVKWGRLTDDDMEVIAGSSERLYGILQQRYGLHRDEAEKALGDLVKRPEPPPDTLRH